MDRLNISSPYINPNDLGGDLNAKASVVCATTEHINRVYEQIIDGYLAEHDDRVLVKNQNNIYENGIYIVNINSEWHRSEDANTRGSLNGAFVYVEEGNINQDTGWIGQEDVEGNTTFISFSAPGTIEANNITNTHEQDTATFEYFENRIYTPLGVSPDMEIINEKLSIFYETGKPEIPLLITSVNVNTNTMSYNSSTHLNDYTPIMSLENNIMIPVNGKFELHGLFMIDPPRDFYSVMSSSTSHFDSRCIYLHIPGGYLKCHFVDGSITNSQNSEPIYGFGTQTPIARVMRNRDTEFKFDLLSAGFMSKDLEEVLVKGGVEIIEQEDIPITPNKKDIEVIE